MSLVIYLTIAVAAAGYGALCARAFEGAFCDMPGLPGPHPLRKAHQTARIARSWARRGPSRAFDWCWGLFDRKGPERALRAEMESYQ